MEDSPDETPWECSDIYIFGKMETFSKRLIKVSIAETESKLHFFFGHLTYFRLKKS